MTRDEQIEKEAHRVSYNSDEFSSFIQGAEWADETMIKKACIYLDANFPEIDSVGTWYKKSFIERFKKAILAIDATDLNVY